MAVTGPIPLPQTGMGALLDSANDMRKFWASIQQGQQRNRQLDQTQEYNKNHFDLQRQAEARAQKLMPHLIQQYEDVHGKRMSDKEANDYYMRLIRGSQGAPAQNQPTSQAPVNNAQRNMPQNMEKLKQFIESGQASPEDVKQIQQFMGQQGQGTPEMPNQVPENNAQQDSQMSGNQQPQQPYDQGLADYINTGKTPPGGEKELAKYRQQLVKIANQDQGMGQSQNPPVQPPQNPPAQQGNKPSYLSPKEEVVNPGNPALAGLDQLPGIHSKEVKIGDHSVAPVKTSIENGIKKRVYPSGLETKEKVGPSDAEKVGERAKTAEEKDLNKINAVQSEKIITSSKGLLEAAHYINKINDNLTKHKHLTSWWKYGLPFGVGEAVYKTSSNKDLGDFTGDTSSLQAAAAKSQTSRPGIQLTQFFRDTKPDRSNSVPVNLGLVKSNAEKVLETWNNEKSDWLRMNPGKEFPFKDPDFSKILNADKTVTIIDPDGGEHSILANSASNALKKYPGSKIKEEDK